MTSIRPLAEVHAVDTAGKLSKLSKHLQGYCTHGHIQDFLSVSPMITLPPGHRLARVLRTGWDWCK